MSDTRVFLPVIPTLRLAWEKIYGVKAVFWASFGIILLMMIAMEAIRYLLVKFLSPHLDILIQIVEQIVSYLLQMGLLNLGIKRAFDQPISFRMIFQTFNFLMMLKIIGVYLAQFILIFIPVIILIVIGNVFFSIVNFVAILIYLLAILTAIYLIMRMVLSMGLVLDKGFDPWRAIKCSFMGTRENAVYIFGLLLLEIVILIISAIPFGLGLIWTLPFTFLVYGVMYKTLLPNINIINQQS